MPFDAAHATASSDGSGPAASSGPTSALSDHVGAPGAMLLIISGPSGVGKDTIIDALRQRHPEPPYHFVVTCTTRAPRTSEINGVSYHFLEREEFLRLRDQGELLEANEVHGNWYGTPRSEVRDWLARGRDVVLKIDVQGAQVVKEKVPDALLIFVVPPSLEALFQRLRARRTESVEELELRQRNAAVELARAGDYDYVVLNDTGEVERTAQRIDEIIAVEHAARAGQRVRV
jgi:guanylate kinase